MGCKRNQTATREGGRGEVDLGIVIIIEKICISMWVYYHVGEDRGWTHRRVGGGGQEVGIPKGWKVGEIGGNYATMLHNILQLKKG